MTDTAQGADTSLDKSLVSGIAWTGIVKWSMQVVSWVATLATVRVLAPTDYGLFGMAMVYIGFGQIVTEAGIAAAVIQRPNLSDTEAREFAGMSVVVGVAFVILTAAASVPVGAFYAQPAVTPILLALSPVFLLRSLQLVPRALLSRELRFRSIALLEVVESLSLVVSTLVLAVLGWGHWALVAGSIVSGVVTTAVLVHRRWVRPALPLPLNAGRVRFTWQVTVSQVAYFAYTNADFAIVGRALGTVALGAYSFAWNIANIAGERVSALIGRVTPPLFAAAQNDPPTLRRYFGLVVEGIALLTLPASIGLSLVAGEFVPIIAGERWISAVEPLRILAVYAAFRSIFFLAPQLLIATGRARTNMRFALLATIVLPPSFMIGAQWGPPGVAAAWVIVYPILALATFVRAALQATGTTWRAYCMALWPAARATIVMAMVVLAVKGWTDGVFSPKVSLAVHAIVGAITYGALVSFALRTRLRPLLATVRDRVGPRRVLSAPVFAAAGSPGKHRILLITYHFTPSSAVGALRWQKMVRLAAERGWEFDVIACAPSELKAPDPSRWADLPTGTGVYAVPSRPLHLFRLTRALSRIAARLRNVRTARRTGARAGSLRMDTRTWWPRQPRDILRAYFAWLDVALEGRWAADAARLALTVYRPGVHRAVITCGPPHEPHMAGVTVAERTGLPLVLDFRDPWSLVQRLPEAVASKAWLALAAAHERRAVGAASLIVTNTAPLKAAMAARYPTAAPRFIAVTNGCDDDPIPQAPPAARFVIAYAGSIYLDRNPRPLFMAVARAIRILGVSPAEFGLEFMGDVERFDGVPLARMAADAGIGPFVAMHPARSRAEALTFLASAAMLVVLPQDSDLAIPAKVFDYMRYESWLMAMTEARSATGQLLKGSGAEVVAPHDSDAIVAMVVRCYHEFAAGRRAVPLATTPAFTRRAQAEILFDAIERITGAPHPALDPELCAAS